MLVKPQYIFLLRLNQNLDIFSQFMRSLCENVWLFIEWFFLFIQSMKLKVVSSTVSAERRFSSWIGGSILASLVSQNKRAHIVNMIYLIVRYSDVKGSERQRHNIIFSIARHSNVVT